MAVKRCLFTIAIIILFRYSDTEGSDIRSTDDIVCRDKEFCSLLGKQLTCSKKLNVSYSIESSDVENLILCNWADDNLDLSNILIQFNNVKTMKIQRSHISSIYSSSNAAFVSLKELNVTKISLKNLTLPYLTELSSLDISHNLVESFTKEHLIMMPVLQKLYLAGNPINCSSEMQWLLNSSSNSSYLVDEKETFCRNDNYKGKPIIGIMKLFQSMEKDCPLICKCFLTKVVGDLIPVISVNCNNLSLTRFPKRIPVNTTILLLKHNKITSMMPLVSDRQYWNVKDVFLDYNQIKTINGLEGSYWLNNFRLVSLQGNWITQLHSYSWDNAFEHNQQLVRVYFGFNPWKCDCNFTPGFRELILKYQDLIKDVNDIKCAYHEDDENSMLSIAELPIKAFCTDHSLPLHPLDYLSIIFASSTLLILSKLFYDWWYFKRTGKLPWLVANMP